MQTLTERIGRFPFALSLLMSALLFALLHAAGMVRFEDNDDVVMALIASGKYNGEVDPHLVFSNVLYGFFLNGLYVIMPTVEWYTVVLVFVNVLAVSFLGSVVIRSAHDRFSKLVLLGFVLSFFIYCSFLIQFTHTASLAAIAGIVLVCGSDRKYLGALLFIIGALLRFEAAYFMLLVALPLFWSRQQSMRAYLADGRLRMLLLMIVMTVGCRLVDRQYYARSPEWAAYLEYNALRAAVNDNPNWDLVNLSRTAVAKEDYQLMLDATADPSAMDSAALSSILASASAPTFYRHLVNIHQLMTYARWFAVLAIIVLSILYVSRGEERLRAFLIAFFFGALLIYVSLTALPKDRLVFPAFFGLCVFLLVLPRDEARSGRRRIAFVSLGFLAVAFGSVAGRNALLTRKASAWYGNEWAAINDYLDRNTAIAYHGTCQLELLDPFHVSASFRSQRMYFAGWLTHIPFNAERFDSFQELIDGHGVVVAANYTDQAQRLIPASILTNHHVSVEPVVASKSDRFVILEFRRKKE